MSDRIEHTHALFIYLAALEGAVHLRRNRDEQDELNCAGCLRPL